MKQFHLVDRQRSLAIQRPTLTPLSVTGRENGSLLPAVSAVARSGDEQVLDFTSTSWRGPPRSFLTAQSFLSQGKVRQHHRGHMMVPVVPTPSFVMIQSKLVFNWW